MSALRGEFAFVNVKEAGKRDSVEKDIAK